MWFAYLFDCLSLCLIQKILCPSRATSYLSHFLYHSLLFLSLNIRILQSLDSDLFFFSPSTFLPYMKLNFHGIQLHLCADNHQFLFLKALSFLLNSRHSHMIIQSLHWISSRHLKISIFRTGLLIPISQTPLTKFVPTSTYSNFSE